MAPWLAPGALLVAFLLTFFPWGGVYPNGRPIYTQTAWQAAGGKFTPDPVGDRVMKREVALTKHVRWSGWLMFYVILLIPAVVVAGAERVIPWLGGAVPVPIRPVWPYRHLIVALLCAVLVLLLVGALLFGFGLEVAAAGAVEEAVPPSPATADGTPSPTSQVVETYVKRDVELASYALYRTYWMALAVNAHLVALLGAGLTMWLERRPDLPEPWVECYC